MPLETATHISGLVASNPASSDGLNQADDHMRLIKSVLLGTFPNFTNAALNSTQAQLDNAVAQIATIAANSSLVAPGALMDFGMPTAPAGWLACDGQAVSRTTFAALFTAIGATWGAGDGSTTFNVPNLANRFRRHRDNGTLAGVVGNLQNPCNLSHTHSFSATTGLQSNDHTHGFVGTTGADSPAHTHNVSTGAGTPQSSVTGGGSLALNVAAQTVTSGAPNQTHSHSFSGFTAGESANHTHTVSGTTAGGSADNANEARPFSATVLTCIKT